MSKLSANERHFYRYAKHCELPKNKQRLIKVMNDDDSLVVIPDKKPDEDEVSWNPEDVLYDAAVKSQWDVLKLLIDYHIKHHIKAYDDESDEYLHGQYLLRRAIDALVEEYADIELPQDILDLCERFAPSKGDTSSEGGFDDLPLPSDADWETARKEDAASVGDYNSSGTDARDSSDDDVHTMGGSCADSIDGD